MAVDLGDERSLAQTDLIREGTGCHRRDNDSAGNSELADLRLGNGGNRNAELGLPDIDRGRSVGFGIVAGNLGVDLGTVSDGDVGGVLDAVAKVANLNG